MSERLTRLLPIFGDRHDLVLTTVDGDWVECAIVRRESGEAVGSLAMEDQGASLFVGHLWVAPAMRGYGAGSECAWLLRRMAAGSGVQRVQAWAHPGLGLSVYFLIRMGFRPLHGEGPNGGIGYRWVVE